MEFTEEQGTVRIPESVTINGVTFTVKDTPELQQFVQGVAKVEKQKVYSQIENLKQRMDSLNGVNVLQTPALDTQDLIEQMKGTFLTREQIEGTVQESIKKVVQPLLSEQEKNHKDALIAYRESLIRDNEATCMPELVRGNTKEELDASLRESIALRQKYPSPFINTEGNVRPVDPILQASAAALNTPFTPTHIQTEQGYAPTVSMGAPRRESPDLNNAFQKDVKNMSAQEFAAQREALLSDITSTFGQN